MQSGLTEKPVEQAQLVLAGDFLDKFFKLINVHQVTYESS